MFKVAYVIEVNASDWPITVASEKAVIGLKVDDEDPILMSKSEATDLRDALTEALKMVKDPEKPKSDKAAKA